jgi:hypothetical protein
MRRYKVGAHTKTDLKVHLVWIPKYRIKVIADDVAVRIHDILRHISMEHEFEIITSEVSRDHVHIIPSDSKHQQDHAMSERDKLPSLADGVPAFAEKFLGQTLLGHGIPCSQLRQYN